MNTYLKSAIMLLTGILSVTSTFIIEYYFDPKWLIDHYVPHFFPVSKYIFFFRFNLAPTSIVGIILVFTTLIFLTYKGLVGVLK